MLRRRVTVLAVFAVLALVAAACSSTDDGDTAAAGASAAPQPASTDTTQVESDAPNESEPSVESESIDPGSQVGITETEINLALIYTDTAALVAAGFVPDTGDIEQDFEFFVDQANEQGRFGGRTASMTFHSLPAGAAPSDQIPACVAATEDRENFVVLTPGGLAQETILCTTEQHETPLLTLAGAYPDSVFERSGGRFFSNGMRVARLYENVVAQYSEMGLLDGATIGMVRQDDPEANEVAETLRSELVANGHEVAEDIALPCENTACTGIESAVEVLRGAEVDALFSFLGPIAYATFVETAGGIGYVPQYFSSSYQNQVFQTTARLMQPVAQWYDGAIGATVAFDVTLVEDQYQECNDAFTAATGVRYEPRTDAWGLVGNSCDLVDRIARVVERIEADGLEVGQDTFISYLEQETVQNQGQFAPGKHDAYDISVLREFVTDCTPPDDAGITVCWQDIEGTDRTWES